MTEQTTVEKLEVLEDILLREVDEFVATGPPARTPEGRESHRRLIAARQAKAFLRHLGCERDGEVFVPDVARALRILHEIDGGATKTYDVMYERFIREAVREIRRALTGGDDG